MEHWFMDSSQKIPQSLNEFIEAFPEGVLYRWLVSGLKAHQRKANKGKLTKARANKLLKKCSQEQLEELRKAVYHTT